MELFGNFVFCRGGSEEAFLLGVASGEFQSLKDEVALARADGSGKDGVGEIADGELDGRTIFEKADLEEVSVAGGAATASLAFAGGKVEVAVVASAERNGAAEGAGGLKMMAIIF